MKRTCLRRVEAAVYRSKQATFDILYASDSHTRCSKIWQLAVKTCDMHVSGVHAGETAFALCAALQVFSARLVGSGWSASVAPCAGGLWAVRLAALSRSRKL